jgi:hypothetical protein
VLQIDGQKYPLIIEILDENYDDGIDRVEGAWEMEDGSVEAIAWDAGMQFVASIADTIEMSLIGEAHDGSVQFAAGKARNCKAGVACGGSCIAKGKNCSKKASPGQKEKIKELTSKPKASTTNSKPAASESKASTTNSKPAASESKASTAHQALSDQARKYADAVSAGDNSDYFKATIAHLNNTSPDKADFTEKMIALHGSKPKKPLTAEQKQYREDTIATAIKVGEKHVSGTKGSAADKQKAFINGVTSHLAADEEQRAVQKKALSLKTKKRSLLPAFEIGDEMHKKVEIRSEEEQLKILLDNPDTGRSGRRATGGTGLVSALKEKSKTKKS